MRTIAEVYEKAARDAGYLTFGVATGTAQWAYISRGTKPSAIVDTEAAAWKAACFDNGLSLEYALDDFTKHYLVAALWTEEDNLLEDHPRTNKYDIGDLSFDALEKAVADCNRFQTENADLLAQAYELYESRDGYEGEALAGHDFWLTRNHHGVGYWDRTELGEVGNRLSEACAKFEEVSLYVSDDEKVYTE